VPTGASFRWTNFVDTTAQNVHPDYDETETATFVMGSDLAGRTQVIILEGILVVGATAGTFQLQWAQNTAQALDTKVLKSSFMIVSKMTTTFSPP